MCRSSHVGDKQVEQSVVIQIGAVRPHRGPASVRHRLLQNIGECAVAVIAVEVLRVGEIVGYIQIGPTVPVVIPPRRRETMTFFRDPGALADIGEMPRTVILEKAIWTAASVDGVV